jgi:hypothetical protein
LGLAFDPLRMSKNAFLRVFVARRMVGNNMPRPYSADAAASRLMGRN